MQTSRLRESESDGAQILLLPELVRFFSGVSVGGNMPSCESNFSSSLLITLLSRALYEGDNSVARPLCCVGCQGFGFPRPWGLSCPDH